MAGSQTDAAYSNSGRTKTLYAFSLMLEALIFKLRLRKPRTLFALEQVLLMWSSQLTVLFIVTPRYLADETFSRVCPWRGFLLLVIRRQGLALGGVELSPCPSSPPPNQRAAGGLPVAGLGRCGHWKSSCTLPCRQQRVVLTLTISQAYH